MKRYIGGVLSAVFVVWALSACRDQLVKVYASPQNIDRVENKVDTLTEIVKQQGETQKQLVEVTHNLKNRQDTSEKVAAVQVEALRESIRAIRDLKGSKNG